MSFGSDLEKFAELFRSHFAASVVSRKNLHLVTLLTLQSRSLMVMQMVELERLFGEEKLAACMTWDVRVPCVYNLMSFQARVIIES